MENVIIRRPSPSKANGGIGQSEEQAISAATGWEYEHGETDAQINAIEALIGTVRAESGASTDNHGVGPGVAGGDCLRGATFSWNVDSDGDVVISTSYTAPGDGVTSYRGVQLTGRVWVSSTWLINPDGLVVGPREA